MAKKQDNRNILIIGGIILAIVFLLPPGEKEIGLQVEGGSWDISKEVMEAGYEIYLVEESDFDYSDPRIQELAQGIKENSNSPDEAIKQAARLVVQNIDYQTISVPYCFNEKASTVVEAGFSDCVGMSRLVTSISRAMGIPARTAGGCLSFKSRCDLLFAAVPGAEIKVAPLVEGDFKKRGFLHEWVEIWTPDKGWFIVEATAGRVYDIDCSQYIFYDYDSNNRNRCVIQDQEFWALCQAS